MIHVQRPQARSRQAACPAPAVGDWGVTKWSSPAGVAAEGGDWAETFVHSDGIIAFTIGDVSGHGATVAESMRLMRSSVIHALRFVRDPSSVLAIANNFVFYSLDGRIVTAIVALLDCKRRTLTYANAGHPAPLLLTEERTRYLWQPPADLPLGIFRQHYARTHEVELAEDSLLLFYTDGITEHARDIVRGEVELAQTARSHYDGRADARAIAETILESSRGHDDATMMVLRSHRREP